MKSQQHCSLQIHSSEQNNSALYHIQMLGHCNKNTNCRLEKDKWLEEKKRL